MSTVFTRIVDLERAGKDPMKDKAGREIDYMRISITDRCNLRCKYCMPDDIETTDMANLLTYEEIVKVTEMAASLGIRHIRLTGGEPLVRRGCVDLVKKIKNVSGIDTVGMTTNGVLLAEYAKDLKEAGLDSVNVSLDTLDAAEFQRLTGRNELKAVLAGIGAVQEVEIPVKINTVHYKNLNWRAVLAYADERQIPLRFIEMMPIGYGAAYTGGSNEELFRQIGECYGNASEAGTVRNLESEKNSAYIPELLCAEEKHQAQKYGAGPAVYYRFPGLNMDVGFISALHHKFCSSCNRIRLTSEGYLKLCLCYEKGVDLRAVLRNPGKERTLQEVMKKAIFEKPAEHCFEQVSEMTEHNAMVRIGG